MKNNNRKKGKVTGLAVVTTVRDPWLIKAIVEKRAVNQYCHYHTVAGMQKGWMPVASSSIETVVTGSLILSNNKQNISIGFNGVFLFTCIKTPHTLYSLEWGVSLS